jgi:hypothetical protein
VESNKIGYLTPSHLNGFFNFITASEILARSGAFCIGKEGNARDGRSFLASSLILPLYMSGEELIWEAAMMIFICDIAPAVAGCITFSGAKLAGIVILQGHAQLPRNNPQNLTLCIKFGPS